MNFQVVSILTYCNLLNWCKYFERPWWSDIALLTAEFFRLLSLIYHSLKTENSISSFDITTEKKPPENSLKISNSTALREFNIHKKLFLFIKLMIQYWYSFLAIFVKNDQLNVKLWLSDFIFLLQINDPVLYLVTPYINMCHIYILFFKYVLFIHINRV